MASEPKIITKLVLVSDTCAELLKDPENVYVFPALANLRRLAASKVRQIFKHAQSDKQRKRWIRETTKCIKDFTSQGTSSETANIPKEWVTPADRTWFRLAVLVQILDDVSTFKAVNADALVKAVLTLEDAFLACYPVHTGEYNMYHYAAIERDSVYRRLDDILQAV